MTTNIPASTIKQQAFSFFQDKQFQDAKALYAQVCTLDPADAEAWYFLGIINGQLGALDEAEACLRQASSLQPQRPEIHFNLGNVMKQRGKIAEAETAYRDALNLKPDMVVAHANLSTLLQNQGRIEEALIEFGEVVRLAPASPEVHFNLGNLLKEKGSLIEAESAYRESLQLKPDLVAARVNLGLLLQNQGRLEEALAEFGEVARLGSASHEVYFNLGNLLKEKGSLIEAETAYREALRVNPKFAEAYDNLGVVLRELQRFNEAAKAHRESLRLKPNSAITYYNLGVALAKLGWYPNAMDAYSEAVRLDPDYLSAWINLAGLYASFGPWEKALECYRIAQNLDPTCKLANIGEASVLEKQGDFKQAYILLQPFLTMHDPDYFAGLVFAALCRPLGRCDEAIALMEKLLERDDASLVNEKRANLHFELGRLYDSRSDFDAAFRHCKHGNEMLGRGRDFNAQKHAQHIEDIIRTYNSGFIAQAPRARLASRRPVFIVGMPRSGTSLVEQILASHPDVFGGGELDMMSLIVYDLPAKLGSRLSYPSCMVAMGQTDIDQMAQHYLEHLFVLSPTAERVTDKMPENFLHLGLINLLFPEARVIHCKRDSLDTCLSCYFQNFELRHPYSQELGMLGGYYRQYERLMNHWAAVLDIHMMEVNYEDLVADQERKSRTIIEFCGLKWDDRCLRFYDTKRVVGTASHDQVRRPIYQRSINRWKNYEAYLGPLKEALGHD